MAFTLRKRGKGNALVGRRGNQQRVLPRRSCPPLWAPNGSTSGRLHPVLAPIHPVSVFSLWSTCLYWNLFYYFKFFLKNTQPNSVSLPSERQVVHLVVVGGSIDVLHLGSFPGSLAHPLLCPIFQASTGGNPIFYPCGALLLLLLLK